ncbi:alpha-ketoglutarate-dependent taurine dioxygenase [Sinorhizobium meliloti]
MKASNASLSSSGRVVVPWLFCVMHPEPGERTLELGSYVARFVGVSKQDSRRLFDLFGCHITAQENTVRWKVEAG